MPCYAKGNEGLGRSRLSGRIFLHFPGTKCERGAAAKFGWERIYGQVVECIRELEVDW